MRRVWAWALALALIGVSPTLAAQELEPGEEEEVIEDHTVPAQKPKPPQPLGNKPKSVRPPPKAKPEPPKAKPEPPKAKPTAPAAKPTAPAAKPTAPAAKPTPPPAPEPSASPSGDTRPSIFVYVYPGAGVSPAVAADITTGICTALDSARYTLVDLEPLYGDQAVSAAELSEADRAVGRALRLLNELEIQAADTALDSAIRAYEKHLVTLLARDAGLAALAEAQAARAVARFLDGDDENAQKQLQRSFVIDPEVASHKLFPPDMALMVGRERQRFEELGTGSLDVETPGSAAQIIVNGQDVATSPAHFENLPVGVNYVTLSARNHPTITVTVAVQPGETARLVKKLPDYPGDPLASVDRAASEVGKKTVGQKLRAAAELVGKPDRMLLVTTASSDEGTNMKAYLYDLRTGSLVGKNEGDAVVADPVPAAQKLARPLYALSTEVKVKAPAASPRDTGPPGPPIWKHRYFWPAVGVAGGIILITGIIIAADGLSAGQKVAIFGVSF